MRERLSPEELNQLLNETRRDELLRLTEGPHWVSNPRAMYQVIVDRIKELDQLIEGTDA